MAIVPGPNDAAVTVPAGDNLIGRVKITDGTDVAIVESNGSLDVTETATLSTLNATSGDGSTALTNSAQAVKASAGSVFGWYIYNPNSVAAYVVFYNATTGNVTVGTTNPQMILTIPATSAANILGNKGISFSTAISVAATSTAGGNGAPSTALEVNIFYV